MPGNIRISVLEAFDLPETISEGEDVAIKVAIGTREYQTAPSKAVGGKTTPWNLDFEFPVLNLRDNLSVALLDAEGEPISKNEIDTPSIVEKGSFDVNLLLNGGGNVHVSLSFVLTEEERRRIDVMRAAALKRREQEASKVAASTKLVSAEGESQVGSPELQSLPVRSLGKETEKGGVPKDSSATASQAADISQIEPVFEAIQEDLSLFAEHTGKLDKEPTGIADSTVIDSSSQGATKQMARTNLDLTDSFSIKETDSEDQKSVCLDKGDTLLTGAEENEELVDDMSDAKLKPTSSTVKAKIKAFEKTRPQSATKQNHKLSPSSKIQKLSPHSKPSQRKKVEVEAEHVVRINEPLHDLDSCRIKNQPLESANQMEGVEPDKSVLLENVATPETFEAGSTAKEQNCPVIPTRTPEDNELDHGGSMDHLQSNERDSGRELTSRTVQKQFPFGEPAQGLATVGIQDSNLGFQATEMEQPKYEETKTLSMQGRKNIDLVGLSKQVLSGAVSGAVVIAAFALLWAAKPKRRNSSLPQRSKQRKRK